jgi:hypothetical protein
VPDLKEFFEEGAEPLWRVRNLTGHELGRVNEAAERNKNVSAILEALVSANAKEKVEAVKETGRPCGRNAQRRNPQARNARPGQRGARRRS